MAAESETTTERFWRWLHRLADRKIKECVGGLQLKCPNCNQWSSIVGVEHVDYHTSDPMLDQYKCLGCNHLQWWRMHGPCAESVNV